MGSTMPRTPEEFNDYVAKELRAAYAALIKWRVRIDTSNF